MNNALKIPFALNKMDGKMYEPKDAEKSSKEFICPCCNEPLTINKGKIKVPYFSHKPDTDCKYAEQTSLHLKAKEILENNPEKYICVPEMHNFWVESKFIYSKVYLEKKIDEIIPDVILEDKDGNRLLIEITVTHGIDDIKTQKIKNSNLNVLEIDLMTTERDINTEELTLSILNELDNKYWVYDKNLSNLFKYVNVESKYCHINTSLDTEAISHNNCFRCKHSINCLNQEHKICKNKLKIPKDIKYQEWINMSNKPVGIEFKKKDMFANNGYDKYISYKPNSISEEINFRLPELFCKSEKQQTFADNCRDNIINRFLEKLKFENEEVQKHNFKKLYNLLLNYSERQFEFWTENDGKELDIDKSFSNEELQLIDNGKLSFGFVVGANCVSKNIILKWKKCTDINWNAFLWYISEYFKIIDFGSDSVKIYFASNKQLNFFYKKVRKYTPSIGDYTYETEKKNTSWVGIKGNSDKNNSILLRLSK